MKRKNLITLLAFFPLFSVWGQSSLNPVEKREIEIARTASNDVKGNRSGE